MNNKFVKTKNVKAFISLVTKLQNSPNNVPKMGLVYGEPGLGKTNAIIWCAVKQEAIIITAKNGMSARWFLSDLVTELGETPKWQLSELFNQAIPKLLEKPRMLIVDEVDYLATSSRAIETIRDIHDKTGIPILLVGMGAVDKKLSRYKHLFDRIVDIYKFLPFDIEDVREIITSLSEVEIAEDVIAIIHQKSNRFRQIVKTIIKIENFAKTNDYTKITKQELGW